MTDDEYIKLLLSEAHRHDQMARIMQDQALAEGHRLVLVRAAGVPSAWGVGKFANRREKDVSPGCVFG